MTIAQNNAALPVRATAAVPAGGPLGRDDWLSAGLRLLVEDGVEAVRVLRLAEVLGVTRGSFYWHFKNREDLLDGLIEIWAERNTAAILEAAEQAVSLAHGILSLFDAWSDSPRFDPRLDQALRSWARRSDPVRDAVERADDTRVEAIAALFARYGYEEAEAVARARILYFMQVGSHALGRRDTGDRRFDDLEATYEGLTGRSMDPQTAAAFRKRHGVNLGSPVA